MSLRNYLRDLDARRVERIIKFLGTYPDHKREMVYVSFLLAQEKTEAVFHAHMVREDIGTKDKAEDEPEAEFPLFSESVRRKFPVQVGKHERTAANARWMLRNVPTLPFTPEEKKELIETRYKEGDI